MKMIQPYMEIDFLKILLIVHKVKQKRNQQQIEQIIHP